METLYSFNPPTLADALANGEAFEIETREPVPGKFKYRCDCGSWAWPFQIDDVRLLPGLSADFICDGCYTKLERALIDFDGNGVPANRAEFKARYIRAHGGPSFIAENIGKRVNQEPTLEELRAIKKKELFKAADQALKNLVSNYPEVERQSWPKQEQEARAYLEDSSASTPFLNILANERGETLSDVANLVVAKADALYLASGLIIGQRKALEQELEAASENFELSNIVIPFQL